MMDAAFKFSFNGLNMEFAINLAADGYAFCGHYDGKVSTPSPTH